MKDVKIELIGTMPMALSGYLMRALGTAYPNAKLDTSSHMGGLSFIIPADEVFNPATITEEDLAAIVPAKEDPEMAMFTSGFRDGSLGASPPTWLSTLLLGAAEALHDDVLRDAPNYLSMDLRPRDGGEPFTWIICRRGAQSPHALRQQAEQRVARLEEQLKAAGMEPVA